MKLFLLRHGEASFDAATDAERPLTPRGEQEARALLSELLPELAAVTKIFASPYRRAQETAAIAQQLLNCPLETSDQLTPESSLSGLASLWEQQGESSVLFVSHQPLVGRFVHWITGAEPGRHAMGTSALAALECEVVAADCGQLHWLRQPGCSHG